MSSPPIGPGSIPVRSASLGQLAVYAGLLPEDERRDLAGVVANRARAGVPISFGRLLLKGGLAADELQRILARGASLHAAARRVLRRLRRRA